MAVRLDSLKDVQVFVDGVFDGSIEPSVNDLAEVLYFASDQYYNIDGDKQTEVFLTDDQFDQLESILRALNPNHPFFAQVGSDVRGSKVDLPYELGSLDQLHVGGDVRRWIISNGWPDQAFCLTDKVDGTSGLIIYGRGGLFQVAYSRGNGIQGADITRHVKRMPCVPKKMPKPCAIRVEVVLYDKTFEEHVADAQINGQRVYKNARNMVAGRMNAIESPQWFYENVRVIGTSVIDPEMGKEEQLLTMSKSGFEIPAYVIMLGSELNDDDLTNYIVERKAAVPYAIDGIVIDVDDHNMRVELSKKERNSLNPSYSKKFKTAGDDNVAFPKVVTIHWQPSKDGYLKPTIEVEPTDLGGVTIRHCTAFNAKFVKDNNIGPGAVIQLTRSGDVIPFVQQVIQPASRPQLPTQEQFGKMTWSDNEVDLILVDPESNEAVQRNMLIDVFNKLEIPFLREGAVDKLFDAGYKTVPAIIKMTENELKRIIGNSAGEKIYAGMRAKLNPVPLHIIAGASGALGRGIGRRRVKRLLEDLPEMSDWTISNIMRVEGFDAITAHTIVTNLPRFEAFLKEIDGYYTIAQQKEKVQDGPFTGMTFVFTGYRDKAAQARIEELGGTVTDAINKSTAFLITKTPQSTGSKMKKARDLGIKIIGPAELSDMLQVGQA
jgi:NAD-dependent DNA ligase